MLHLLDMSLGHELLYRIVIRPTEINKNRILKNKRKTMIRTRLNPHFNKTFSQIVTISFVETLINRS